MYPKNLELQKQCESMLNYYCKNRSYTVIIEYQLLTDLDSGSCYAVDNEVFIEAESLLALGHELVHAEQLINNKLDLEKQTWKGKHYMHSKVQPWEQQAYGLEQKILDTWLKS